MGFVQLLQVLINHAPTAELFGEEQIFSVFAKPYLHDVIASWTTLDTAKTHADCTNLLEGQHKSEQR